MVTARGDGLKQVVSGSWATFDVDAKGMDGDVEVKIIGEFVGIVMGLQGSYLGNC